MPGQHSQIFGCKKIVVIDHGCTGCKRAIREAYCGACSDYYQYGHVRTCPLYCSVRCPRTATVRDIYNRAKQIDWSINNYLNAQISLDALVDNGVIKWNQRFSHTLYEKVRRFHLERFAISNLPLQEQIPFGLNIFEDVVNHA